MTTTISSTASGTTSAPDPTLTLSGQDLQTQMSMFGGIWVLFDSVTGKATVAEQGHYPTITATTSGARIGKFGQAMQTLENNLSVAIGSVNVPGLFEAPSYKGFGGPLSILARVADNGSYSQTQTPSSAVGTSIVPGIGNSNPLTQAVSTAAGAAGGVLGFLSNLELWKGVGLIIGGVLILFIAGKEVTKL